MLEQTTLNRLIVAADFFPIDDGGRVSVIQQTEAFCKQVASTGVCVKVNSILRAYGYDLLSMMNALGLPTFADLKLNDIGETLAMDGKLLREVKPKFVTAMCSTGQDSLKRLKDELPDSLILGVTVLTTFSEDDCENVFGASIQDAVGRLAHEGVRGGVDGFICSPKEVWLLKALFPKKIVITPGVRFADSAVKNDDQNQKRVMSPKDAIRLGSDGVVMGRPITQSDDPVMSITRALSELTEV